MKGKQNEKIISVVLCLALSFSLMIPAFAAESEPERVTIEVNTMDDIDAFYKSTEYDNTKRYSFIIRNHPMSRIACPLCGKAAWTGSEYRVDEVDAFAEECPVGSWLSSDIVGVFHYHYLERCRSCGYEIVHDEHFFKIECHLAEDIFSYYEAWNKNSIENGNDLHEIKSTFKKAYEKYPW